MLVPHNEPSVPVQPADCVFDDKATAESSERTTVLKRRADLQSLWVRRRLGNHAFKRCVILVLLEQRDRGSNTVQKMVKETRERVFQPTYEDLKHQLVKSRRYRTKWAKRWIRFAFGYRPIALNAGGSHDL